MLKGYEMVVGLEVHVELKTKTKIFCACPTDFGAEPNTQVCPVCLGMPGTLPVLNRQVVDYAVKAGLATHCAIAGFSKQDRKNYFYPDLPKAYQISQYDLPLCEHGYLTIQTQEGEKRVGITRIHIEEDAGKLVHDEQLGTLIDCNRCGVPLIEIVSEPDIRSAKEAVAYVQKLRAIMLYTGISDCKMNEGSLRCDVNLSVHKPGTPFGTRTEMKNLNSFQSIERAITYEYRRQVEALESGEAIVQETRRYDQQSGKTYSMRRKEDADDYRYFPDPDLAPIVLTRAHIDALGAQIPKLPDARKADYVSRLGLSPTLSERLTEKKEIADYFEEAIGTTRSPETLGNLIISEVFRLMGEGEGTRIPIAPEHLGAVAQMVADAYINSGTAKRLIGRMWEADEDPKAIVDREGLSQVNDPEILLAAVHKALAQNPQAVEQYRKGKLSASKALMGAAMRETAGRGNPLVLERLVNEQLAQGIEY